MDVNSTIGYSYNPPAPAPTASTTATGTLGPIYPSTPRPPASTESTPATGTGPSAYSDTPPPPAPTGTTPSDEGVKPGTVAAIATVLIIMVLVGVGTFVIFYRRRKPKLGAPNLPTHGTKNNSIAGSHDHQHRQLNASPSPTSRIGSDKPVPPPSRAVSLGNFNIPFTYEELQTATNGFSVANVLGQGGFGYVYKGVLEDGKVVAIKQLKAESVQGEREFQAEIEIISRIHHRHLVSLVGYCIFEDQRLLVYEFVQNKTLDFHLHGKGRPVMNWATRMKIALGSARGLAYLHEDCRPKIVHRDIKSANILLDNSFEAKVADFGLAKYFSDTETHVTTRIMGTFGYLAPEYASSGKLTEKSDVFSYGVLLLELITGSRPSDKTRFLPKNSMVDWAKPLLTQALVDGNFVALADPKLQGYDSAEMTRMVACAAASVRHSAMRRPQMSQIVRALEGNIPRNDLNQGMTPGHSTKHGSHGSSDYYSTHNRENMKNFWMMALQSSEHGSSEHGGQTRNYGLNPSGSSTEDWKTCESK